MKDKEVFVEKFVNSMKGKQEVKKEVEVPHIIEMLKELVEISDKRWGLYAFNREPLNGKFSGEEKISLIEKANLCGREYANKIINENQSSDVYEIANKLGLKIDYPQVPIGGGHITFAQFVEPNEITIYRDSVDKAISLIEEEGLNDYFGNVKIEEILLAHEIFHYLEEMYSNSIFTRTEKIRLWKFGPFKNDSEIICLGEIAGMAFAKELLKLPYSPYILDVFLVYLYNKEVAYELYKEVMKI